MDNYNDPPNEKQLLCGVLATGFLIVMTFTGTIWANAVWAEFLRPSEPEWWVFPLEGTGIAAVSSASIFLLFMLFLVPIWSRYLPLK